jgi:hypothetical protein
LEGLIFSSWFAPSTSAGGVMDLARLGDELDRLGIRGEVDLNSGQTVNDGSFTIRHEDGL